VGYQQVSGILGWDRENLSGDPAASMARTSSLGRWMSAESRRRVVPNLLIGWELGGGGGHIHRLVPIIDRYLERGWTIVAALRLRQAAQTLFATKFAASLADGRLIVVQAPIFLHRSRGPINASSLAEIFAHIGFAETELWTPVVSAWERLITLHRPDAIISDMAPSLNLAASGRLPVIVIGNGWTIPPATHGPAMFEVRSRAPNSAVAAAARVVETAFKVSEGRHSSDRFCDLLRGKANIVCTLKAFDPYAGDRDDGYFWPFEIPTASGVGRARKRGFIYLPPKHPALPAVLAAVAAGELEFDAYFEGLQPSCPNLRAAQRPLNLSKLLPETALAIHHGGLGTAIECWVNRVPQLICPLDTEKEIIGRGVEHGRAGSMLRHNMRGDEFQGAVERIMHLSVEDPDYSGMVTPNPKATLDVVRQQTG